MSGFGLRGAHPDALPQLALLGLACGLAAGALMIVFRMTVEGAQSLFLPGGDAENYEGLGAAARVLLPLAGGLAVGLLFQWLPPSTREVGAVHVIDALADRGARLPLLTRLRNGSARRCRSSPATRSGARGRRSTSAPPAAASAGSASGFRRRA